MVLIVNVFSGETIHQFGGHLDEIHSLDFYQPPTKSEEEAAAVSGDGSFVGVAFVSHSSIGSGGTENHRLSSCFFIQRQNHSNLELQCWADIQSNQSSKTSWPHD
jgi:hypothetical protein